MKDAQTEGRDANLKLILDRIIDERLELALYGPMGFEELRNTIEAVRTDVAKQMLALTVSGAEGKEVAAYSKTFIMLSEWLESKKPGGAKRKAREVTPSDVSKVAEMLARAREGRS